MAQQLHQFELIALHSRANEQGV